MKTEVKLTINANICPRCNDWTAIGEQHICLPIIVSYPPAGILDWTIRVYAHYVEYSFIGWVEHKRR